MNRRGFRDRRGFLLPTVLLLVVGFTALAMAALALALAEHRSAEWERGWMTPERTEPGLVAELGHGYRVLADGGGDSAGDPDAPLPPPAVQRVAWCLDPDLEAGGAWGASAGGDPAHPPRLGPLAAAELVGLALEAGGWPLPVDGTRAVLPVPGSGEGEGPHAADTLRIHTSDAAVLLGAAAEGPWLLVAAGEVEVEGPGRFSGVVIAAGTFHLKRDAWVRGGVRAGGLQVEEADGAPSPMSPVTPDSARVAQALALLPACPIPVHAVGRLGRY